MNPRRLKDVTRFYEFFPLNNLQPVELRCQCTISLTVTSLFSAQLRSIRREDRGFYILRAETKARIHR